MAVLITHDPDPTKIENVSGYLSALSNWQKKHEHEGDDGFLSQLWYRGVNKAFRVQAPGVYRPSFTDRAERLKLEGSKTCEARRLRLEREVLSQFRTAGAMFLRDHTRVEVYFAAQHFGMPTRLLDWSTNPLAALFFACDGENGADGVVYAMDARKVIPDNAEHKDGRRLPKSVMSMRHDYVEYAVGVSFWDKVAPKQYPPFILPVRPNNVPGRIGQQSSAFTLHMHEAADIENPTLLTLAIDANAKAHVQRELHRLNINHFTTYLDLDHLSKEIKRTWGIR